MNILEKIEKLKTEANVQIEIINRGLAADVKHEARVFNSQLLKELESKELDIISNYDMGLIEADEMLRQRIDNLDYVREQYISTT